MFQRLNENKDLLIVAIASFFIGFGAASLFGGGAAERTAGTPQGAQIENVTLPPLPFDEASTKKISDALTVENQRAGSSVVLQKSEFQEAHWVVVRDVNDDGTPGNILGAGWFPAGAHENMSVPLVRATVGGEHYVAVLFSDSNGDKKFDHKTDQPVKDASGKILFAKFSTVASAGGE